MGVRAPPAVASQVTPSQALAILNSESMAEADRFDDDEVSIGSDMLESGNMLDEEALQPPYLSPIVPLSTITASVELPQDPRDSTADPPNLTLKWDTTNPI